MRRSIFGLLIFIVTLSLGIITSFIWHFSYSRLTNEIETVSVETSLESKVIEVKTETTEPWILRISPCISENSITYPSSNWKGKNFISGGVVNRRAICGKLPAYPKSAKDEKISDVVTVEVLIDEIGKVKEARAKTGNPLLVKSAIEAAYQTRFTPTLLGGASYKMKGILMYKFDSEKGTWLQDPSAPDNPFRKSAK